MELDFLRIEDVLGIHEDQIERYGGASGLRDAGLLSSAVETARATFDGELLHTDVFAVAAAYMFHIVQNHPFTDGNKRTGAAAALVFLDSTPWKSKSRRTRSWRTFLGWPRGA